METLPLDVLLAVLKKAPNNYQVVLMPGKDEYLRIETINIEDQQIVLVADYFDARIGSMKVSKVKAELKGIANKEIDVVVLDKSEYKPIVQIYQVPEDKAVFLTTAVLYEVK
jgi:hypothetical protein